MKDVFEIITTVTPAHIDGEQLTRFVKRGATIFRVNGAFFKPESAKEIIHKIKSAVGDSAKVMIDLPGYKVRFLYLGHNLIFRRGERLVLKAEYFNYPGFFKLVKNGDVIRANNGFSEFRIIEHNGDSMICEPDSDGTITKGRGIHLDGITFRPAAKSLSEFDRELIEAVKDSGLDYVGLSFVHDTDDIEYVESVLDSSGIACIPKIEAKESFVNLDKILNRGGIFILDRGDMAGEMGLPAIWKTQRDVVTLSKLCGCKIVLATQLLHSMVENPVPTVAEVDSLYDLLRLGIDGVQLSEETSVGRFAEESVSFIRDTVNRFRESSAGHRKDKGIILWLLGMTSSGKTTIAKKVAEKLMKERINTVHYDGDEIRDMLGPDFGFAEHNRLQVVKNLVYLANKSAEQGFNVIVSALTAHEDARRYIRDNLKELYTIFVKCSVEECAKRDPKGLYRKAKEGKIDTLIGYSTPYKEPAHADLVIDTEKSSVEDSADRIIQFLIAKKVFY